MQDINHRDFFKIDVKDTIEIDHEEYYSLGLWDILDDIKKLLRLHKEKEKDIFIPIQNIMKLPNFRRIKISSDKHGIFTTLDIITNYTDEKEIIEKFVNMQVLKRYCRVSTEEFLTFILDHADQILDGKSRELAVIEKIQSIFLSQGVPTIEIIEDLQWLFIFLKPDILDLAKSKIKENYVKEEFNIEVIDTTDEIINNTIKEISNEQVFFM